jgi:hypothetical protein
VELTKGSGWGWALASVLVLVSVWKKSDERAMALRGEQTRLRRFPVPVHTDIANFPFLRLNRPPRLFQVAMPSGDVTYDCVAIRTYDFVNL